MKSGNKMLSFINRKIQNAFNGYMISTITNFLRFIDDIVTVN